MIIDAHIHRGSMPPQPCRDLTLEDLLALMDRLGIQTAIGSHCLALYLGDMEAAGRIAEQEHATSGGRICAFHYYDPRRQALSLAVMERYAGHPAFRGIKIHPSFALTPAGSPAYRPAWEFAQKHRLPILTHSWDLSDQNPKQAFSYPPEFEGYVSTFPDVTLVLAHAGGRYNGVLQACALGRRHPNVCFDIAGDLYENGFLEYLVEQVGADRVMYGSDCPMMDPRTMLGVVLGAGLSEAERQKILHDTANRIYFGGELE